MKLNVTFPCSVMRTVCPTASPDGNSVEAIEEPITALSAARETSCSVKNAPLENDVDRTSA